MGLETRDYIDDLIGEFRALDGDVRMRGGSRLQSAFLARGAPDDIGIYVMPEIIGAEAPLFPATGLRLSPKLSDAKPLARGCVYLRYTFSSNSLYGLLPVSWTADQVGIARASSATG